jgi:hypothetical protein
MLALRIAWVFLFREIDGDAYGHFTIAIATRRDPTNLAVHWVWLPLYHFVVGALTAVGLSFRGLRVANALLATLGPLLLFDAARRRLGEEEALVASLALALAPLTTDLGLSAQPETVFAVLIVAALFAAARERAWWAGAWLGLACLVRYEAWGGVLFLVGWWIVARTRPRDTAEGAPALSQVAIPAGVVALYVAFRFWTDGRLLLFFQGTRDITSVQVARTAWTFREIIRFPVVVPLSVLGPAIAFVPFGARSLSVPGGRSAAPMWILPCGFGAFLLASYYGGGSHAGERYLVSLMPFACVAIGCGALRLGRRIARPRAVTGIALILLALTTAWHLRRAAGMAIAWDSALKDREDGLARLAR